MAFSAGLYRSILPAASPPTGTWGTGWYHGNNSCYPLQPQPARHGYTGSSSGDPARNSSSSLVQPALLEDIIKAGRRIWLSGKVKSILPVEIHVSEYEILEEEDWAPGIVPVYSTTEEFPRRYGAVL